MARSPLPGNRALNTATAGSGRIADSVAFWWAVTMAPFLVLALGATTLDWFPASDQAILDLQIRDFLDGSPPLIGAYSHFGWSHPGPVWFYLLAPFRWVLGDTGLVVGSILAFGAGIATAVAIALKRFGSLLAAVTTLTLIVVLWAASFSIVSLPWNPYLALAWLPAFLLLVISSVERQPRDLAPAALVGSLLIQVHVGYLALVGATLVTAVVILMWRRGRAEEGFISPADVLRVRSTQVWLGLSVLVWIPPLVEQLLEGRDGNLWAISRFFLIGDADAGPAVGARYALAAMGEAVDLSWSVVDVSGAHKDPFSGFLLVGSPWLFLVPLLVVGAATVACWFAPKRAGLGSAAVMGVLMVTATVSLSQVVGPRMSYVFLWRFVVVWFCIAAGVVLVVRGLGARRDNATPRAAVVDPIPTRSHVGILAVSVAVLAVGVIALGWVGGSDLWPTETAARDLTEEILAAGEPSSESGVLLVPFGDTIGVFDGVLNGLDDGGWSVGVDPTQEYIYGTDRASIGASSQTRFLVTGGGVHTTVALNAQPATVVAFNTPLSESEEAKLQALQIELMQLLEPTHPELIPAVSSPLIGLLLDSAEVDPKNIDVGRLAELNQLVVDSGECRCAVVAIDSTDSIDFFDLLDIAET